MNDPRLKVEDFGLWLKPLIVGPAADHASYSGAPARGTNPARHGSCPNSPATSIAKTRMHVARPSESPSHRLKARGLRIPKGDSKMSPVPRRAHRCSR
jgi:hypothetical protein